MTQPCYVVSTPDAPHVGHNRSSHRNSRTPHPSTFPRPALAGVPSPPCGTPAARVSNPYPLHVVPWVRSRRGASKYCDIRTIQSLVCCSLAFLSPLTQLSARGPPVLRGLSSIQIPLSRRHIHIPRGGRGGAPGFRIRITSFVSGARAPVCCDLAVS